MNFCHITSLKYLLSLTSDQLLTPRYNLYFGQDSNLRHPRS